MPVTRSWQRDLDMAERRLEIRPEETFISYDLPMTPEKQRVLDSLCQRYTDADGNALVPRYTESLVVLHIPRTLKLRIDREPQHSEA